MKLHKWTIDRKLIMELHDWFGNCMIMEFVLFGYMHSEKKKEITGQTRFVLSFHVIMFWCQWSLCFWHCFSFFYNPQKEKKNMYTDIFIFIYWMQCRTLDTDTLNTWFPWILMNQNWGIFKDFSRTIFFFITRIFMANFTKHIYMLWLILSNFRSDLLLRVSKI